MDDRRVTIATRDDLGLDAIGSNARALSRALGSLESAVAETVRCIKAYVESGGADSDLEKLRSFLAGLTSDEQAAWENDQRAKYGFPPLEAE